MPSLRFQVEVVLRVGRAFAHQVVVEAGVEGGFAEAGEGAQWVFPAGVEVAAPAVSPVFAVVVAVPAVSPAFAAVVAAPAVSPSLVVAVPAISPALAVVVAVPEVSPGLVALDFMKKNKTPFFLPGVSDSG